MGGRAMLPKKEPLPGSEEQRAVCEWDGFGASSESHLDVAGHIVRTFVGVGEVAVVFWYEAVEEAFKVVTGAWVRIFHENEAAAGVSAKDGERAVLQTGLAERVAGLVGNFESALAAGTNLNLRVVDGHGGPVWELLAFEQESDFDFLVLPADDEADELASFAVEDGVS